MGDIEPTHIQAEYQSKLLILDRHECWIRQACNRSYSHNYTENQTGPKLSMIRFHVEGLFEFSFVLTLELSLPVSGPQ